MIIYIPGRGTTGQGNIAHDVSGNLGASGRHRVHGIRADRGMFRKNG